MDDDKLEQQLHELQEEKAAMQTALADQEKTLRAAREDVQIIQADFQRKLQQARARVVQAEAKVQRTSDETTRKINDIKMRRRALLRQELHSLDHNEGHDESTVLPIVPQARAPHATARATPRAMNGFSQFRTAFEATIHGHRIDQMPLHYTPLPATRPVEASDSAAMHSAKLHGDTQPRSHLRRFKKYEYLKQASTIVFMGDGWIEIACYICHGNATKVQHTLARGLRGLMVHIKSIHANVGHELSQEDVIRLCTTRSVAEEEVVRILDWTSAESPIPLRPFGDSDNIHVGNNIQGDDDGDIQGGSLEQVSDQSSGEQELPLCVVQKPDGVYIELKCPTCGKNAFYHRGLAKAFRGLSGFQSHYISGHGPVNHSNLGTQLTFDFFEHRAFSQAEIDAMRRGDPDAPTVTLVYFTTSSSDDGDREYVPESDPEEDVHLELMSDEEGQGRMGAGYRTSDDSDAMDSLRNAFSHTRAEQSSRSSVPTSLVIGLKRPFSEVQDDTDTSLDARSVQYDSHRYDMNGREFERSTFYGQQLDNHEGTLSLADYCPCTLSDHACKSQRCERIKICLAEKHNHWCADNKHHHIRPTCIRNVNADCKDSGNCIKAHDNLEQRSAIYEDHQCYRH